MPKFVTDEELAGWFGYHPPSTPEVVHAHEGVREACRALAVQLNDLVPEGPTKSVALRKVREAMFYANAAIACQQQVGSN